MELKEYGFDLRLVRYHCFVQYSALCIWVFKDKLLLLYSFLLVLSEWAEALTEAGRGKHHIGDFLPPDELERFMETFEALKDGRTPDYSEYKEFKLTCDNIGYQMLQKLGWKEGEGLGQEGQGITQPVNK